MIIKKLVNFIWNATIGDDIICESHVKTLASATKGI